LGPTADDRDDSTGVISLADTSFSTRKRGFRPLDTDDEPEDRRFSRRESICERLHSDNAKASTARLDLPCEECV
jgi:hypothetical protein